MPTGVLTLVVGCGSHVVPSSNSFFTHIVLLTSERELIQMEIISGSDFTIYNYNLQLFYISWISKVDVTYALTAVVIITKKMPRPLPVPDLISHSFDI